VNTFLLKLSIGSFMLVGFIFVYGVFCDYFFTKKQFLDIREKKQWVLAQEGGDWDYAVLGSSRAFGAFNMRMLDSLTRKRGINIASDGSGFKDNYLILSHFLKSNAVDILLIQVDEASLNSKESFSNEFHAFRFLPYWQDEKVKRVLKSEIPAFDGLTTEIFPYWRYFYFNKYFSPKEVIKLWLNSGNYNDSYKNTAGGKGYSLQSLVGDSLDLNVRSPKKKIIQEDWNYLLRLILIAEHNKIRVLAFVAPTFSINNEFLKTELNKLQIPVFFPDDVDAMDLTIFLDHGHLNTKGRNEFTPLFADFFNEEISN
jgi:hypothetical protein